MYANCEIHMKRLPERLGLGGRRAFVSSTDLYLKSLLITLILHNLRENQLKECYIVYGFSFPYVIIIIEFNVPLKNISICSQAIFRNHLLPISSNFPNQSLIIKALIRNVHKGIYVYIYLFFHFSKFLLLKRTPLFPTESF